ncbi:MAG: hypothetical protein IPJ34_13095 [Myxococcales bacterium]|nr:hypothetical protein [Myxococcales bacterium]
MATAIGRSGSSISFPSASPGTTEVRWDGEARARQAVGAWRDGSPSTKRPGKARPEVAQLLAGRAIAVGIDAFVGVLSQALGGSSSPALHAGSRAGLAALAQARRAGRRRLRGRRSFAELLRADLLGELRTAIGHAALARLDTLAPTHVVLGNRRKSRRSPAPA